MSIAFESDEVQLQKLRERLRQMSDDEPIKFGKIVRDLSELRVSVTPGLVGGKIRRGACRVERKALENSICANLIGPQWPNWSVSECASRKPRKI
jgi:hypothetical protein